jgi:hypothetical protein
MATGTTKLQGHPTLTRALHKSGRRLCVEMSFAIVKGDESKVLGAVAVARDVTERVEQGARCKPIILSSFGSSEAPLNGDIRAKAQQIPTQ